MIITIILIVITVVMYKTWHSIPQSHDLCSVLHLHIESHPILHASFAKYYWLLATGVAILGTEWWKGWRILLQEWSLWRLFIIWFKKHGFHWKKRVFFHKTKIFFWKKHLVTLANFCLECGDFWRFLAIFLNGDFWILVWRFEAEKVWSHWRVVVILTNIRFMLVILTKRRRN